MDIYKKLADIMFPNINKTIDDYEKMYPERTGESGQVVTRFAPSPTGFVHIGGIYASMINEFYARQHSGTFYLRIEDTDQARQIENGVQEIVNTLKNFDIDIKEGAVSENEDLGNYGPYRQSMRKEIYQTFAKHLVSLNLAYPCFCSKEELEDIRNKQTEENSSLLGYGGKYAKCRNLTPEQAIEKINAGEKFIVRLRAPESDLNSRITARDIIRGEIEMASNNIDAVVIKSDGLPTYHFAHVVDDHLMRTTHVIRGDEWISSLPLHLQMFRMLGFKAPKYAHVCPIMKMDGNSKRKLSKRKDPEARVGYFYEEGFPNVAVKEYLLNLINSTFEEWREKNPNVSYLDFNLKLNDISASGALFDFVKLNNVSKKVIKGLSDEVVVQEIENWAKSQAPDFYNYIQSNREKFINSVSIWHFNRMDIAKWSEVESNYPYLYNNNFADTLSLENLDANLPHAKEVLTDYLNTYNHTDEQSVWFDKIRQIATKYNYAVKPKDYKNNPELYNGSIVEVSTLIRQSLTGQKDSPDIYKISQFLGEEEVKKRTQIAIDLLG